jgi:site-specific DNA-cytosine methylase
MITVGSFFTGIGEIDLAFVRAGFRIAYQVEIDPFCQMVLRNHAAQHWPAARARQRGRAGRDLSVRGDDL